jgi:hypothetical protein
MEIIYLIGAIVLFFFTGLLASEKIYFMAIFFTFIGFIFMALYTEAIKELPIKIKSTEKLELIKTITTPIDTIYKYQIINK